MISLFLGPVIAVKPDKLLCRLEGGLGVDAQKLERSLQQGIIFVHQISAGSRELTRAEETKRTFALIFCRGSIYTAC